jgi:hypothetical protein
LNNDLEIRKLPSCTSEISWNSIIGFELQGGTKNKESYNVSKFNYLE